MASNNSQQQQFLGRYSIQFRAGRMITRGGGGSNDPIVVSPDIRKGLIRMTLLSEKKIHYRWVDRTNGNEEDHFHFHKDEVECFRVSQCTTGRVFVLKWKNLSAKLFFWIQEARLDRDEEIFRLMNEMLNNSTRQQSDTIGISDSSIGTDSNGVGEQDGAVEITGSTNMIEAVVEMRKFVNVSSLQKIIMDLNGAENSVQPDEEASNVMEEQATIDSGDLIQCRNLVQRLGSIYELGGGSNTKKSGQNGKKKAEQPKSPSGTKGKSQSGSSPKASGKKKANLMAAADKAKDDKPPAAEKKTTDTKPADTKPDDTKPADTKPDDPKPAVDESTKKKNWFEKLGECIGGFFGGIWNGFKNAIGRGASSPPVVAPPAPPPAVPSAAVNNPMTIIVRPEINASSTNTVQQSSGPASNVQNPEPSESQSNESTSGSNSNSSSTSSSQKGITKK